MSRVLIVDDDEDCRQLVARILRASGYDVTEAEDGREGISIARMEHPDAVVTDVNMPHADGWHVRRTLAASPETTDIVVIVLTSESARGHSLEKGLILKKPLNAEGQSSLLEALSRI